MKEKKSMFKGYVLGLLTALLVSVMVVPGFAATVAKTITVIGGGRTGGVVLGAKVPVLLVSRAASADDKYMSIVVAALIGHGC